jgi:outer membrane protein assembly factor BamB
MTTSRLFLAALLLGSGSLLAADWPQWRGPQRTDIGQEKGLEASWPAGGPKLLWTCTETGVGYSGPAIVGNRLYTMGALGGKEHLFALDTSTGKKVWSTEIGPFYESAWGGGPRGTPTVDGELIYAVGGQGILICARADNGAKVWQADLAGDLGGKLTTYAATWGYTESPLVDGDRVFATPGGPKGTLAAFDKKKGTLLWRSTEWTDDADYSSVIKHTVNNVPMVIQMTGNSVAGLSRADGSLLWRFPRVGKISISTPIAFDHYVYVSSSYSFGCDLIELTPEGKKFSAKNVYDDDTRKVMQNHHGGVILWEGHLFGYSDPVGWVCQEVRTGKKVWQSKKLGKGSITFADGHFVCYGEDKGECVLIEASTKDWIEKGRFTIPHESKQPRPTRRPGKNIWTHPVVANGRLYLRDQEFLFCYDVKEAR